MEYKADTDATPKATAVAGLIPLIGEIRKIIADTHMIAGDTADRLFGAQPKTEGAGGGGCSAIGEIPEIRRLLADLKSEAMLTRDEVQRLRDV